MPSSTTRTARAATLGVITKSDLVKPDSDIVQRIKMEGKNIQLELGFIALRCRTPSEVKAGVTREKAMSAESDLFATHPLLSQLAAPHWGLRTLVRQIVGVQADRVEEFIPEIKLLLSSRLMEAEAEYDRLAPACADDAARNARMNEMIRRIDLDLHDIMSGARHFGDAKLHLPATWVALSEEMAKAIRNATPDYLSDEYMDKLKISMKETQGVSPPNFMSNPVFRKSLVEVFFAKSDATGSANGILLDAAKSMVSQMKDAMLEAIDLKVDEFVPDFPKLNVFVKERVVDLLEKQSKIVVHHFEALFKAELAKPYTFNHYYMDTLSKIRSKVMERARVYAGVKEKAKVGDRVMPGKDWASHYPTLSYKDITPQTKGIVLSDNGNEVRLIPAALRFHLTTLYLLCTADRRRLMDLIEWFYQSHERQERRQRVLLAGCECGREHRRWCHRAVHRERGQGLRSGGEQLRAGGSGHADLPLLIQQGLAQVRA